MVVNHVPGIRDLVPWGLSLPWVVSSCWSCIPSAASRPHVVYGRGWVGEERLPFGACRSYGFRLDMHLVGYCSTEVWRRDTKCQWTQQTDDGSCSAGLLISVPSFSLHVASASRNPTHVHMVISVLHLLTPCPFDKAQLKCFLLWEYFSGLSQWSESLGPVCHPRTLHLSGWWHLLLAFFPSSPVCHFPVT